MSKRWCYTLRELLAEVFVDEDKHTPKQNSAHIQTDFVIPLSSIFLCISLPWLKTVLKVMSHSQCSPLSFYCHEGEPQTNEEKTGETELIRPGEMEPLFRQVRQNWPCYTWWQTLAVSCPPGQRQCAPDHPHAGPADPPSPAAGELEEGCQGRPWDWRKENCINSVRLSPLSAIYHLQQLDWGEKDCMNTVRTSGKKTEYPTNSYSLFKEGAWEN